MTKFLAGLLAGVSVLLAVAAVATASSSRQFTTAGVPSNCPATAKAVTKNQAPLYVYMAAYNDGGVLQKNASFPLRRYRNNNHYSMVGWAVSGCWAVFVYSKHDFPKSLCLTVRAPYTPVGNACQTVQSDPQGRRTVLFYVKS